MVFEINVKQLAVTLGFSLSNMFCFTEYVGMMVKVTFAKFVFI